jgi:hypothetical protein
MLPHRHVLAAVLAATLAVVAAPSAEAGQYAVHACDPAMRDVNHSWVAATSTPDMAAYAACPAPASDPHVWSSGLVTRHAVRAKAGSSVPLSAYSWLRFVAPPGGILASIQYSHAFCGGADFRAGLWTPRDGWLHASAPGSCGTMAPSSRTIPLNGVHEVRVMTSCEKKNCDISGTVHAYAVLRSATVWIAEYTLPSVAIAGGTIGTSAWQRGIRTAVVDARDGVGIRSARIFLDDHLVAAAEIACDYTLVIPCAVRSNAVAVDTSLVPDGRRTLLVTAEDSAGNANQHQYAVNIDNTAPWPPIDLRVDGAGAWQRTDDFSIHWANPSQDGVAPIAGARYTICPQSTPPGSGADCASGTVSRAGVTSLEHLHVRGPGAWVARVWLVDAAGNETDTSARAVPLRFDDGPPTATIAAPDVADPQRVTVLAQDALSGIATGEIEIRREGTAAWIGLPVQRTATGFTAVVDDAGLPDGVYDVRAHVVDVAGNERSTTTRASGAQAHLVLPLRVPTSLTAGGVRVVRGRHGRGRQVLTKTATAAFGVPVVIRGRLTARGGNALANADVEVLERTALADQPWVRVGITRTGPKGRFRYRTLRGPSRTVLFRYAGTRLVRPGSSEVEVRVRAKTTIGVSRHAVVNGDEVQFRGRVHGGPMPPAGKLLQLQAYSRGTWRTFATPRARPRSHRWRYTYRFSATQGTVRYRFRAVLPREGGFPFERGASHQVRVRVRGL